MTSPIRDLESNADYALLEHALRHAVAIGAVLVLVLPAARGFSATFGWLPLWLLAMPLSAWWALHRFRLPSLRAEAAGRRDRRRRGRVQACRRLSTSPSSRRRQMQAA